MPEPSAPLDRSVESAPKVLTIDRSLWLRGNPNNSKLRDSDGKMCCLGFDALACGVKDWQITDVGNPGAVMGAPSEYIETRVRRAKDTFENDIHRAIDINDDPMIDDNEREAKLINVLKQLGWDDVRFVDGNERPIAG